MPWRLLWLVLLVLGLVAPAQAVSPVGILYSQNFDHQPLGGYGLDQLRQDWGIAYDQTGVRQGRVAVGGDGGSNHYLSVAYPAGKYGSQDSGAQWMYPLPGGLEAAFLSYQVRFQEGFQFVKGGKLPGLAGGAANSGGHKPNGGDGWSARIMWRGNGRVVQYVYHPLQGGAYGQDFPWAGQRLTPGLWHTLQTYIELNTPGQRDGVLRSWLDGALVLDRNDMMYRTVPTLKLDKLFFSSFFGGNDQSWAPTAGMTVDFDDFVIAQSYK